MHRMLPDNLYYTLSDTALKLDCSISKLIHLAANGYLSLCVKVYSPPPGFNELNDKWSCDLLVNEDKVIEKIPSGVMINDAPYEGGDDGTHDLVRVKDEYITRYTRLSIGYDCFLKKKDNILSEYCAFVYGVYGLLTVPDRYIFMNENLLLAGEKVKIKSFFLPIDTSNNLLNGYFRRFSNPFDESWRSDTIDSDNYALSNEGLINGLDYFHDDIEIDINNLYVTSEDIERLNEVPPQKSQSSNNVGEKFYKLPEFCKSLVMLATDMTHDDLEKLSADKLKIEIGRVASRKGIEFPDLYHSTLSKYLGKNKK